MNTVLKISCGDVIPVIKRVGTLHENDKGYIVIEYSPEPFQSKILTPDYSTDPEATPEGRFSAIIAGLQEEKNNGKKK